MCCVRVCVRVCTREIERERARGFVYTRFCVCACSECVCCVCCVWMRITNEQNTPLPCHLDDRSTSSVLTTSTPSLLLSRKQVSYPKLASLSATFSAFLYSSAACCVDWPWRAARKHRNTQQNHTQQSHAHTMAPTRNTHIHNGIQQTHFTRTEAHNKTHTHTHNTSPDHKTDTCAKKLTQRKHTHAHTCTARDQVCWRGGKLSM